LNTANDPIEVKYNPDASRFEVQLGDGKFAQIAYQMEGDVMLFVHTEVPKEFGGRGIADKMAYAALEYAKANGLQVMALCPFVKAYIGRHPEYQPITIEYPG
jgi:predicted GNAT family acetyltransferase